MNSKPTPEELLIAIHKHCMECSGGSRREVQRCKVNCALWLYRLEPTRERAKPPKGQMSLFDFAMQEETRSI